MNYKPILALDSVDSDVVVRCINDFCKDIDKKTVLVMDNSSIHTSETFQENIPLWKEKELDIFYLPKYSPELNIIEILWRFIKYEWIELDAIRAGRIWLTMWKMCSRTSEKNIKLFLFKYLAFPYDDFRLYSCASPADPL